MRPGALAVARQAIWVFDLDGVVADVRRTYRAAYVEGLARFLERDLGLPVAAHGYCSVADVSLLKQHEGFNAPEHVAAFLLRAGLCAAVRLQGRPLTRARARIGAWVRAAMVDGRLSRWREALVDGLGPDERRWVEQRERLDAALAWCRESYAGSAHVEQAYGISPRGAFPGRWQDDRLLLDPAISAGPLRRVGVYTGRTRAEARFLMRRFDLLREVPDVALACTDGGDWKPDPAPLERLRVALGGGPLVYFGDVAADRSALLGLRAREPSATSLLAQVRSDPAVPRWAEADLYATTLTALLVEIA
jgi:phosphoglycolate phosphatase-like HAD superfamily hydrolase